MRRQTRIKHAFTLIELLIVVAIIAILAAIAVPNFLEAQIRAKISAVKSDMRTLATALETYMVDNNQYLDALSWATFELGLTTPIAYIATYPVDIFKPIDPNAAPGAQLSGRMFGYGAAPFIPDPANRWVLECVGPDLDLDVYSSPTSPVGLAGGPDPIALANYPGYNPDIFSEAGYQPITDSGPGLFVYYVKYDPTNGTVSNGDVWRFSDGIN